MDDERSLFAGKVKIYRRNGWWHTRIHLGGKQYHRKALRTANTALAEEAARKLYYETQFKQQEGLPIKSRSFEQVIEEYVAHHERSNEIGQNIRDKQRGEYTSDGMLRNIKRAARFWKEYAGKKSILAIDDKVMAGFVPFRRTYYHDFKVLPRNAKLHPTDKEVAFNVMIGRSILKWAQQQGYRGKAPLPAFTFTPKNKLVRPAFTQAEFKKIRMALPKWAAEAENEHWQQSRWLLHDYVLALGMSGLRPGEANNMTVRDVELYEEGGNNNITLRVRGKTGARRVVPHHELKQVIDDMLDRRENVRPTSWLFAMPNGERIKTLIDQFNTFLKAIKLTHSSMGEKYTPYSLRHYYAIRSLERSDVYDVARNMGTSVRMIEQYYGKHAITAERARKLSGYQSEPQRPSNPFVRASKKKPTRNDN